MRQITVIGSGQMGHGIAEVFAINGYSTVIQDISDEILEKAINKITASLEKMSQKNYLDGQSVKEILDRIKTTTDLADAVRNSDLIIEAIPEIEELKIELFKKLDQLTKPDSILTTNTSNIRITDIARNVTDKTRVAGFHFFNPPVIMNVIEVIKSEYTSEDIFQKLIELTNKIGKTPISVMKDSPGFVVNRIVAPETFFFGSLVEKEIAYPSQVDAYAKSQGMKMGPYELFDFIGIDIVQHSLEYYSRELSSEYSKCTVFKKLVDENKLGQKTLQGFYDWTNGRPEINMDDTTDKIDLLDIFAIDINESIKLIEEGVATPEDIETAVKLGLNRPFGPISVAKSLTNQEIKEKLESIKEKTGSIIFDPATSIKNGRMKEAIQGKVEKQDSVKQKTEVKEEKSQETHGYKTIKIEKMKKKVAKLIIDRPRHNTITDELLDDLDKAIDELANDAQINVVIVTGKGNIFSAGAELSQYIANVFQFVEFARKGQRIFKKLSEMPKLTIAVLKGHALGGGLELALACDLRIADKDVQIGLPEVTLGLVPAWGGTQRLPKLIGLGKAMELITTGRKISGQEAFEIGIVNKIFEKIDSESIQYAESISETTAPISLALAKRLVNSGMDTSLDTGLEMESFAVGVIFSTDDLKEGISSFLQKKKPNYKGK